MAGVAVQPARLFIDSMTIMGPATRYEYQSSRMGSQTLISNRAKFIVISTRHFVRAGLARDRCEHMQAIAGQARSNKFTVSFA